MGQTCSLGPGECQLVENQWKCSLFSMNTMEMSSVCGSVCVCVWARARARAGNGGELVSMYTIE